jgi:hypothetical protein
MNIKDRIIIEIEAAKKRSFTDHLRESVLSKANTRGVLAHYEKRVDDLMYEMTKEKGIADNWVLNGRRDILEKEWLRQVILKKMRTEKRPENEVWQEVQLFLKQYSCFLEYEHIIKDFHDKRGIERDLISNLKDACDGTGKFEAITDWFIKMGYCNSDTFGYDHKKYPFSVLASYLKDLNKKGYSKKLSHKEIRAIAKNSFNAEMGVDTIKRAKADTTDLPPIL